MRAILLALMMLMLLAAPADASNLASHAELLNTPAHPGDEVILTISLIGTQSTSGWWAATCDTDAESNPRLNITSWLRLPFGYQIAAGQQMDFQVIVSIPMNATGLYGATSTDATQQGAWAMRKTYVEFYEYQPGPSGQMIAVPGMRIPISILVTNPTPTTAPTTVTAASTASATATPPQTSAASTPTSTAVTTTTTQTKVLPTFGQGAHINGDSGNLPIAPIVGVGAALALLAVGAGMRGRTRGKRHERAEEMRRYGEKK